MSRFGAGGGGGRLAGAVALISASNPEFTILSTISCATVVTGTSLVALERGASACCDGARDSRV